MKGLRLVGLAVSVAWMLSAAGHALIGLLDGRFREGISGALFFFVALVLFSALRSWNPKPR